MLLWACLPLIRSSFRSWTPLTIFRTSSSTGWGVKYNHYYCQPPLVEGSLTMQAQVLFVLWHSYILISWPSEQHSLAPEQGSLWFPYDSKLAGAGPCHPCPASLSHSVYCLLGKRTKLKFKKYGFNCMLIIFTTSQRPIILLRSGTSSILNSFTKVTF